MQVKKYNLRLIGRREHVSFPLLGIFNIEAKIDTGAYTSSLHCEDISVITENDKSVLKFTIAKPGSNDTKTFYFNEFTQKKIKNSFGEMEERYIIRSIVIIGKKKIHSNLSLSNRDNMRYPVLIGRKLIKGKFLIDPNQVHIGGTRIAEDIKKIIN
jgi:hypothetical protein